MLLQALRAHDYPGLFVHINTAWRAAGGQTCDFRSGMIIEIGESLLATREDHPSLAAAAHLNFPPPALRTALLGLPFAG
jgi:hypothetical protein